MGIYGALSTAVTGLRAQSYALENISGNIANSQTIGFKKTETSFIDLVPDAPANSQVSGSVLSQSRATNDVQGDIQNAAVATFMGINGDGYFIIEESVGLTDNLPVFSGTDKFTRRGDFQLDLNGYLVNGAGYYLKGLTLDPDTGNPVGSNPEVIRVTNDLLPAQSTTEITYRANLPAYPLTSGADPDIAGSELLVASGFTADPTVAGTGTVIGSDVSRFLSESIAGGAVTVFDANGSSVNVQFRWAKLSNSPDTWNMFYQEDSAATGTDVAWRNVGSNYTFSNSQLSPAINAITLSGLTIDGTALGDVQLTHGGTGVTQFSDPNGTSKITQLDQNGYSAGELSGITIADGGTLTATYTNGRTQKLSQVILAAFNADNQLKRENGGAFTTTQTSGNPIYGAPGRIIGGAIEASNTDIADEFTKMIVTQQAYVANTRVVSTSDEMLQEVLRMVT